MFLFLILADKVSKKAENIDERRNVNKERALQLMEKLKDQLQLHHFLQVIFVNISLSFIFAVWINLKMPITI